MNSDLREITSDQDPLTTYQESIRDIHTLLTTLDEGQWSLPTPCPGWSISDIAAHLIDLDAMAMGAPPINHEPDWASLPHVKNTSNQFTERGVDYRRGTPPAELLAQLQETSSALVEFLADNSPSISVPWAKDQLPRDLFLIMRTFDVWAHEQDIRATVGAPGNWGTNPARSTAQRMISSIPLLWAKKVGAPAGSALTLTLTGPDIEGSVHVITAESGKAIFTDDPHDGASTVTMSWPDFFNAFGGRVPATESIAAATFAGEYGESLIRNLPSTP